MDDNTYKTTANEKIASFDYTYSSDHIRMLKILLHYLPNHFKRHLAIYIKYMELQQTFRIAPKHSKRSATQAAESTFDDNNSFDFSSLIHELIPLCNAREKQQFQNMENMINQFEQMKSMLEMFEMMKDMKDMFGDGDGGFDPNMLAGMMGGTNGFDPSMLAGMMNGTNGFDFNNIFGGEN